MSKQTLCYWFSKEPLVVRYVTFMGDDATIFPEERIYRLPFLHWHVPADRIERQYHIQLANRPQHVVHYLLNERDVCDEVVKRGIPATLFNHNAVIDENRFVIQSEVEKEFDAIYIARMNPFKRHVLARRISRLMLIAGRYAKGDDESYFSNVQAEMPQAEYVMFEPGRRLGPREVARQINRARVGLCLSACEGAMYAAVEYLLCGLPVVSTESVGGRSEWFDPEYVRIVPDNADAVNEAVQELVSLKISPHLIRGRTLSRMRQHRRRFIQLVQGIYNQAKVNRSFAKEWRSQFFNKFGRWRNVAEIMDAVHEDCR